MLGTPDPATRLLVAFAAVEGELARRFAGRITRATGARAVPTWSSGAGALRRLGRHGGALAALVARVGEPDEGTEARLRPGFADWELSALRSCRGALAALAAALARGEDISLEEVLRPRASLAPAGPGVASPSSARAPSAPEAPLAAPRALRVLDAETVERRLLRTRERWFSPPLARSVEAVAGATGDDPPTPSCWYEVTPDARAGLALCVVVPPFGELPSFVRVVSLAHPGGVHQVRNENLRRLGARVTVEPAPALAWAASSDDPDLAPLLARLRPASLSTEAPTVFRLGVEGPTQRLVAPRVAPGGSYAVLVPPALVVPAGLGAARALGAWTLVSVEVPGAPDEALHRACAALEIAVGSDPFEVTWVGAPPALWRLGASGERAAVWSPGATPLLCVRAAEPTTGVCVSALGPGGLERLVLPTGSCWYLTLEDLTPGGYALEVAHAELPRAWLAFEVSPTPLQPLIAAPKVSLDGVAVALDSVVQCDLREGDPCAALRVEAPPAMPAELQWTGASQVSRVRLAAEADGTVPCGEALAAWAPQLGRATVGTLRVRFPGFGEVRLEHRTRFGPRLQTWIHEVLGRVLSDTASLVPAAQRNPAVFRAGWARPLADALGWELVGEPPGAPPGRWVLARVVLKDGRPAPQPEALLRVLADPLERASWVASPLRCELRAACASSGATWVLLTDGAHFWRVEPERALLGRANSLAEALRAEDAFEDFLQTFSTWG